MDTYLLFSILVALVLVPVIPFVGGLFALAVNAALDLADGLLARMGFELNE